jgi:hypothetical protein
MLGELVTPRHVASLADRARQRGDRWIHFDETAMRRGYDRAPFLVEHSLHRRRAFELEPLSAFCKRRPDLVGWRRGRVPVTEDFARSFAHYAEERTLDQVLADLGRRESYVLITNPERDPEYREVMEEMLGEIALATAELDPGITWYSTYIFISSAGSLTPYHMDREMNFLMQIRGQKFARLWIRDDEEVMTAAEKDELLAYASDTRPPFRESIADKAMKFDLREGMGLHHPFIAPHIIETTAELSISLAFTYRTRRTDRWTNAHRWNHGMRKLGLRPIAVETSPLMDRVKSIAVQSARGARRVFARPPAAPATQDPQG